MYLKLTKINKEAEIGGYDAIEITGTKLDDGTSWSKSFFANNDALVNALDDFGVGEDINVVMEKKGKFWNIKDFAPMEDGDYEKISGSGKSSKGTKSTGGGGKKGSGSSMSKEEWAEKDRKTAARIARAVALKAAIENLKEGATVSAVIKRADEFLPYLEDKKTDPLDVDID